MSRYAAGPAGTGAIAGALSTLVFTWVHQLMISPIWFALPMMLVAGVLCGTCIAWSHALIVRTPTIRSWLAYNALYLGMFVALGVTSQVVFEPVTTVAELIRINEPPTELIVRALPVTTPFTIATAGLLSLRYRPGWLGAGSILVTTAVLVLFLGLNVSVLGFVAVPRSDLGVLGEMFVLLLVILGVYAGIAAVLGRERFRRGRSIGGS